MKESTFQNGTSGNKNFNQRAYQPLIPSFPLVGHHGASFRSCGFGLREVWTLRMLRGVRFIEIVEGSGQEFWVGFGYF